MSNKNDVFNYEKLQAKLNVIVLACELILKSVSGEYIIASDSMATITSLLDLSFSGSIFVALQLQTNYVPT